MRLDIQAREFSLTDALRQHIERRLGFALSGSSDQIHKIEVRLSDINGPRGGEDKHCHIHILLNGVPDVVIEDTEKDMYNAINRAADRAGRTVLRRLSRHRELNRDRISHALQAQSV